MIESRVQIGRYDELMVDLVDTVRTPCVFTLHLDFSAEDLASARDRAVIYAEGLSILRPEIPLFETRLSAADDWLCAEPVFCGLSGPDGELCADVLGHPGFHTAPGVAGLSWGAGDTA